MIVTLTSKGQLTVPKAIRDQLKLDAGSKLQVSIQADGMLSMRPMTRSVDALYGLLHRPGRKPLSLEQMNAARDASLAKKHERLRRETGVRARTAGKRAA